MTPDDATAGIIVRPARPSDAADYVAAHLAAQLWAYGDLMPPEFTRDRTAAVPEATRSLADDLVAIEETLAAGGVPFRQHWVAELQGQIVGVASAGSGPGPWEAGYDPPPADIRWVLDRLYVRPEAHGSGAGQQLFDAAVGDRSAYLWILKDNPRAERFYRRNGFAPDGTTGDTGPTWFHRSMFRMVRRVPATGLPHLLGDH